MSRIVRSTLHIVASATTAAVVARVVDSQRRGQQDAPSTIEPVAPSIDPPASSPNDIVGERTRDTAHTPEDADSAPAHGIGFRVVAQATPVAAKQQPHEFGPTPAPVLRTRPIEPSQQPAETIDPARRPPEARLGSTLTELEDEAPARAPNPGETREPPGLAFPPSPARPEPPVGTPVVTTSADARGPRTGAVTGTITDALGGALHGVTVEVVAGDATVVETATTDAAGRYKVDGIPPGNYRMRACDDADQLYEESWHGGPTFSLAATFAISPGTTCQEVSVALRFVPKIEVAAALTKGAVDTVVTVTSKATGAPAGGVIAVSTRKDTATTELVAGKGQHVLKRGGKWLRVDYDGDCRTSPASTTVRLP